MSIESNKAFVADYIAAIRKDKSPATLNRYISEEQLKQHIAMYESVLPGYWIETEDLMAEGDKVHLRGKVHGIHKGPLGNIPPTGKKVAFDIHITYRIESGKIAEHWMLVDMMALMQQIGAMPTPA